MLTKPVTDWRWCGATAVCIGGCEQFTEILKKERRERHSRNHESGAAPAIKEGQRETREKAAESTERGDSDL